MINEIKKRIIDKRIKEKFMMDDVYLNGQAKICGWQATLAYISLCRHSNISQESFPSIKLMGEEVGVSRETIIKGLENLKKYNVIQIKKNRTKGGQWLNNTYTLIDKSEWIKHQVADTDLVDQVAVSYTPSGCEPLDQVAVSHTKETHKQGNTYKETHILAEQAPQNKEIPLLIDLFKEINPSYGKFFNNTTQRAAVQRLLDQHGFEAVAKILAILPQTNSMQYAPVITTPLALEDKFAGLAAFIARKKIEINNNKNNIIVI